MSRAKAMRAARVTQTVALRERIEAERRRLQRASAVLLALIYSSDRGLEGEQASDVASVAQDLVEQAVAALDSVMLQRPDGAA